MMPARILCYLIASALPAARWPRQEEKSSHFADHNGLNEKIPLSKMISSAFPIAERPERSLPSVFLKSPAFHPLRLTGREIQTAPQSDLPQLLPKPLSCNFCLEISSLL